MGEDLLLRQIRPPDERLCPACKGMRKMLTPKFAGEYGWNAGERFTLIDCPVCSFDRQQEYLAALCGLSEDMRAWTFTSTIDTPANGAAYDYLAQLAQKPAWTIALQGPNGVGKTRLLACLVNAGRANGWTSIYTTMGELLDHLRAAYGAEKAGILAYDGLWERITNCRILAIDECDRFNPTPWARSQVFELIDVRYRHGADRCTAFATNAEIADLDDYLASRLHDGRGRIFQIAGGDWRPQLPIDERASA